MIKIILVFVFGVLESLLYTAYLIAVGKRNLYLSDVLSFIYMVVYLGVIAYAIKDTNTIILIITYALSSSLGNHIIIKRQKLYEKK